MSLSKGDHLVIKRGEKILGPADEAYHEFEVMDQPSMDNSVAGVDDDDKRPAYKPLTLRIVK